MTAMAKNSSEAQQHQALFALRGREKNELFQVSHRKVMELEKLFKSAGNEQSNNRAQDDVLTSTTNTKRGLGKGDTVQRTPSPRPQSASSPKPDFSSCAGQSTSGKAVRSPCFITKRDNCEDDLGFGLLASSDLRQKHSVQKQVTSFLFCSLIGVKTIARTAEEGTAKMRS